MPSFAERSVDDVHECMQQLKALVACILKHPYSRSLVNEFLFKLKEMDKELRLMYYRVQKLQAHDTKLMQSLAKERAKGRQHIIELHSLNNNLNQANFKLRVRSPLVSERMKSNAQVQVNVDDDSSTPVAASIDLRPPLELLRNTTRMTMNVLRSLFSGFGVEEPVAESGSDDIPLSKQELVDVICALKQRNDELTAALQGVEQSCDETPFYSARSSVASLERDVEALAFDAPIRPPPDYDDASIISKESSESLNEYTMHVTSKVDIEADASSSKSSSSSDSHTTDDDSIFNYVKEFEIVQSQLRLRQESMERKIEEYAKLLKIETSNLAMATLR